MILWSCFGSWSARVLGVCHRSSFLKYSDTESLHYLKLGKHSESVAHCSNKTTSWPFPWSVHSCSFPSLLSLSNLIFLAATTIQLLDMMILSHELYATWNFIWQCVFLPPCGWLHLVIHIHDSSHCHSSVTLGLPTLYLRISKLWNISYWLSRRMAWFHAPVLFRERNGRDWYFNCNFPIKIKKWEKTIQISVPRKTLCSCPPCD